MDVNVGTSIFLAIAISEKDSSGDLEPGPHAKEVKHLETPSDNCTKLTGPPPMLSEVVTCNCVRTPGGQGGTRNPARDLQKKGSTLILQLFSVRQLFSDLQPDKVDLENHEQGAGDPEASCPLRAGHAYGARDKLNV